MSRRRIPVKYFWTCVINITDRPSTRRSTEARQRAWPPKPVVPWSPYTGMSVSSSVHGPGRPDAAQYHAVATDRAASAWRPVKFVRRSRSSRMSASAIAVDPLPCIAAPGKLGADACRPRGAGDASEQFVARVAESPPRARDSLDSALTRQRGRRRATLGPIRAALLLQESNLRRHNTPTWIRTNDLRIRRAPRSRV